jgi:phosphate/sulfate permease
MPLAFWVAGGDSMGIGVSIFLIAVGAILTFALETDAEGVNLDTVGVILMIVGIVGILLSMLVFGSWREDRRDRTVVRERDVI